MNNLTLIGGVIGDIIGSTREFECPRNEHLEHYPPNSNFTDETVMVAATLDWLDKYGALNTSEKALINHYRNWGLRNIDRKFPPALRLWILSGFGGGYPSSGNSFLARITPLLPILSSNNLSIFGKARMLKKFISVTHTSRSAYRIGALFMYILFRLYNYSHQQTADSWHAIIIGSYVKFKIPVPKSLFHYQGNIEFDLTAENSLNIACAAILEASSFDEAILKAISAGDDCDTNAFLAGCIASNIFGIPSSHTDLLPTFFNSGENESIILKIISKGFRLNE